MTLQELIFYCATTDENGKRDIEKCYDKGRADLLMPYDVESIEELIENVRNKARADAIDEYKLKLFNAKSDLVNDIHKAKVWVDFKRKASDIAEELKQVAKADKMIDEQKCVSVDDCHKHCKNDNYLCNECHKIFNDCFESTNPYQE